MTDKLLSLNYLEFLSFKGGGAQAHLSLHLSNCHIIGYHMSRLMYVLKHLGESSTSDQTETFQEVVEKR